jgi:hypothetical protein
LKPTFSVIDLPSERKADLTTLDHVGYGVQGLDKPFPGLLAEHLSGGGKDIGQAACGSLVSAGVSRQSDRFDCF